MQKIWPGIYFQIPFYFKINHYKKESEEVCMLILTYFGSFTATFSL